MAVMVAGCAASRAPQTAFGDPEALQRAVARYYARQATEVNRNCLNSYMYGLTQVHVAEQQPERLVVDVRYLYRDRNRDGVFELAPGAWVIKQSSFEHGRISPVGLPALLRMLMPEAGSVPPVTPGSAASRARPGHDPSQRGR